MNSKKEIRNHMRWMYIFMRQNQAHIDRLIAQGYTEDHPQIQICKWCIELDKKRIYEDSLKLEIITEMGKR